MDNDGLRKALRLLDGNLIESSAELDAYYQRYPGRALADVQIKRHLSWMIGQAYKHLAAGRVTKAHRWLGFIQGALWGRCAVSITDLRDMNRNRKDETHESDDR